MGRILHWKAKVVLSSLLLLLTFGAFSQSLPATKNITYSCRSERLGNVIQYLSKQSGYDFIYSRDLVDVSQLVSLTVKNKPFSEVLSLIERQASVSFKVKDHHIIVKNNPRLKQAEVQTAKIVSPPDLKSNDSLLITSISRDIPAMQFQSHAAALQDHLDKRINEVQRLLGAGTPRNIPQSYLSRINYNNRYKSWYASAGTFASEDGGGLELQAGLPYLYVVFTPHIAAQGFYGSYGVGNSFSLVGNFSFNTMYLYSSRTRSESAFPFVSPMGLGPEVRRTETVRQHQVKMTVQYAFSKNITVRLGPVLNYRSQVNEISIGALNGIPESNTYYSSGTGSTSTAVIRNGQVISASRVRWTSTSWIGWDASIQYRINFFDRK
jgi:hypothetical protein